MLAIMMVGIVMSVQVGRKQARKNRALSVIMGGEAAASQKDKAGNKEKQKDRQRADIARKLKEASKEAQKEKDKDKLSIKERMMQAGYDAPVSRYWIWSSVFAGVVWGFLWLVTSWAQIAVVLITFTAFLGVPRLFLKIKAGRRQRKFLEDFADVLEAMVRLLQAGMPISEAVAMVSREYTGPIKEEMLRVYENQKVGIPLGEAAHQMAERIPLTEVHMFATALQIQSETGSSLSEVLMNLAAVIRARFRLKRKVRALSSEAKASAAIIAALPVVVCLGLYLVRPEYIGILFTTPMGKTFLTGAVVWMLIGVLIMRQMINFKV